MTDTNLQEPLAVSLIRRHTGRILKIGHCIDKAGTPAPQGGSARPMSLQPPEVQRRLSSLWASAGEGELLAADDAAVGQVVEDCLGRIAARRARAQRTMLRQALEAADRQGDRDRVLKLLSEHPSIRGGDKTT